MRKIIIDTDTGSDDAMGIIYALLHPNFDVLALTTVAGNVPLDLATKNAQYCADLCGQTIKIYKGASKPWVKDLETGQFAHGEDGMGDTNLPYGPARIEEMNAASALVKLVNENIGEIDIFAIGPLTNIAEAINLDPHFPEKVRELWIMGGNGVSEGNITEYAEFNYYVDPHAAKTVTNAFKTAYVCDWKACLDYVRITDANISDWLSSTDELLKFSVKINEKLIKLGKTEWNSEGFVCADLLPFVAAQNKEDVVIDECCLDVETDGKKAGSHFKVDGIPNTKLVKLTDPNLCAREYKKIIINR